MLQGMNRCDGCGTNHPLGKCPTVVTVAAPKRSSGQMLDGAPGSANLVVKRTKHGFEVKCPKGLWSVTGSDFQGVVNEALHYYMQYAQDGEYDSPNHRL